VCQLCAPHRLPSCSSRLFRPLVQAAACLSRSPCPPAFSLSSWGGHSPVYMLLGPRSVYAFLLAVSRTSTPPPATTSGRALGLRSLSAQAGDAAAVMAALSEGGSTEERDNVIGGRWQGDV